MFLCLFFPCVFAGATTIAITIAITFLYVMIIEVEHDAFLVKSRRTEKQGDVAGGPEQNRAVERIP